jgi:two-component system sensor histidine kinase RegB
MDEGSARFRPRLLAEHCGNLSQPGACGGHYNAAMSVSPPSLMPSSSTLPPQVLLGKLLVLRIVLVLGWSLGIAWLHWGLNIAMPLLPMAAVLLMLVLFSLGVAWRLRRITLATQLEFFSHLLTDLTAFAVLVYFSGGVTNPFASLMLVPVVIAAISLRAPTVWALAGLAGVYYGVLLFNYLPLAVADPVTAYRMHLGGMWFNFVISAAFIAFFITRMNLALREHEQILAALREKNLRDERILALGTQAALAAHELATPLASIAMTAGELAHEYANDPEIGADCQLLREQAAVCKTILNRLAERAREGDSTGKNGTAALNVAEWLMAIVERWTIMRPQASVSVDAASDLAELAIAPPDELEQALLNLFNNAADVSPGQVKISARRDAQLIHIEIADRGPGFSDAAKRQAGRVLFTGKPGHGLGLGLTLTHATVERLGGEVSLTGRTGGGARVVVSLPIKNLKPR